MYKEIVPPRSSAERNKFSTMIGRRSKDHHINSSNPYETMNMSTFHHMQKPECLTEQEELRKTFGNPALRKEQHVKNSKVQCNNHYETNFEDQYQDDFIALRRLVENISVSDFEQQFYKLVRVEKNHVASSDIPSIIKSKFGLSTPNWIIQKFAKEAVQFLNVNKRISWDNFSSVISIVLKSLSTEFSKKNGKSGIPEWISLANSSSSRDNTPLAVESVRSQYQDSFDGRRFQDEEYCNKIPRDNSTTRFVYLYLCRCYCKYY